MKSGRVTTNKSTIKSGGKMSSYGNDGTTKGTSLPHDGAPANRKPSVAKAYKGS